MDLIIFLIYLPTATPFFSSSVTFSLLSKTLILPSLYGGYSNSRWCGRTTSVAKMSGSATLNDRVKNG